MQTKKLVDWLWNSWCFFSIIGIWPRFIEPNLLSLTKITLPISSLFPDLDGLKILHFSDLHWQADFKASFHKKLIKRINQTHPDLIIFTGDFIDQSRLERPDELLDFLSALKAKIGCFAVLGNHDYENYVTINAQGDYDVIDPTVTTTTIGKGFKRLFDSTPLSKKTLDKALETKTHFDLLKLVEKSPFQLLHNSSVALSIKNTQLNICGLGEYTLGDSHLAKTFKHYKKEFPGIILTHNPDVAPRLLNYPGDIILAGHTHGGQVNLPFIWNKFTRMENPQFKRGLKKVGNKSLYVSRGVGSGMHFRWFSQPEITLFTLTANRSE